ncbi:UDP-N-acetylmuramoyl-tripeptide--D-alanyl-D-alanine ligase [Shouchella lonarensis]|uniref:UDP-N-acetylmuramoyl-tripeptide--D-alanyl-D-alanine ligase n=1 Tax=Shouchella lonarensis TaxID=1464122 RepID=A0A1G6KVI0_9BACI|nr:UDP-N-acetylmuramoyl-tripeptide--D-alanyl-D-alanine ligase [Shouchella lonarensis]SDC35090.1 UDP-N-acetylmuramoyl-tripeptide--D-alanyl-D-alanine ligase [Shouchella lonarensis]
MSIDATLVQKVALRQRLANDTRTFASVSTDTRHHSPQSLFVPLRGERFNGHTFLDAAIEAGATATLWQEDEALPREVPDTFQVYYVTDTTEALQNLARLYREHVNPFIIGITGSNGKTTTKDMVATLLEPLGVVHKTKGNFNNHIGVPLSLLSMPSHCDYAVIELGMNHPGEIAFLSRLAAPNAAIVTNIGEAHIAAFGSRTGIADEKMSIRSGLTNEKWLWIDGDESLLTAYADEATTVGYASQADVYINAITPLKTGYTFKINSNVSFSLPMLGEHNIKNVTYAISLAQRLGLETERIQKQMNIIEVSGMRLEPLQGPNGVTIVNDAYNANPTSMKAAIETVKSLPGYKERVLVLGGIYELGEAEEALHKSVAEVIEAPITTVITVGDKGYWIHEALTLRALPHITCIHVYSVDEAKKHLSPYLKENTVVLLKASRAVALEKVLPAVKGGF